MGRLRTRCRRGARDLRDRYIGDNRTPDLERKEGRMTAIRSDSVSERRDFLVAAVGTLAAASLPAAAARAQASAAAVVGTEFRAVKQAGGTAVNLFLWRKQLAA